MPDDMALGMGQDLMLLGFPKGQGNRVNNLALARNASLASAYTVPFNGGPFVLVDARLHDGTSGSPVLTKPVNLARRTDGCVELSPGSAVHLAGMHSASIDATTPGREERHDDPLGLDSSWLPRCLTTQRRSMRGR